MTVSFVDAAAHDRAARWARLAGRSGAALGWLGRALAWIAVSALVVCWAAALLGLAVTHWYLG